MNVWEPMAEVYLEPSQTSRMVLFFAGKLHGRCWTLNDDLVLKLSQKSF